MDKVLSSRLISSNSYNDNNDNNDDDSIEFDDSVSSIGVVNRKKENKTFKDETNKNILIIRNLDISKFNDDLTIFMVYAENQVPNNQIFKIEASKLFENTFYVTFRKEFEFKTLISVINVDR